MQERLFKVRKLLEQAKVDAMLVSDVYDIFYLSGFSNFSSEEREGYLLITANRNFVFTDGRYKEAVKKQIQGFTFCEISTGQNFSDLLKKVIQKEKLQSLGFQADNITVTEYKKIFEVLKKKKHVSLEFLRLIKDISEVESVSKACSIADRALANILPKIKSGISEKELAFELEHEVRRQGATLSFPTIVAFGENAAIPHHQTSERKLEPSDFVLIDFGARNNNYCSDCTRTFVYGKSTEKQKKMYETVLVAQQKAINYIYEKSGEVKAFEVDKVARDYIVSQGYPPIPHSLGHGTGVEVHESPRLSPKSDDTLSEGMVFSVEPGIYIPNFGGVRIEDLFVIQKNKLIRLTNSPKKLHVTL